MQQNEQQQKILSALIEKASNYDIDVLDNSMLPKHLKKRKTLSFVIKPPSLEVLAKCALPALKVPESIRSAEKPDLKDVLDYRNEMAEAVSILAHGKNSDYPAWYPEFFLNNITPKELYQLFFESVLKMQTDFFLQSFQIASQNNPMMMMNPKDSTLTN